MVATVTLALACAVVTQAQREPAPGIWDGVYTSEQAARGRATFEEACTRCHGRDLAGTTAPALTGTQFQQSWGGGTIEVLFAKIRDTMPPGFGTVLDDRQKLEIVAYILKANGFPAGLSELGPGDTLARTRILAKGEVVTVENFSLVQTVGCLASGAGGTWELTRSALPVTTLEDVPNDAGITAAAGQALGIGSYRLLSALPFDPAGHVGQKMEARGLVYTEPGRERLTLTSLTPTGVACDASSEP